MNEIFHDMAVVVMVYINDILIFTKTEEEHDKIIEEVLYRLHANDLFLKPEKCFFKQWEIEFLGLIIGPNNVEMDPSEVEGITNWSTPTKVKEVQSFLGLVNFYRQFVEDFKIHKPTNLDYGWHHKGIACQNASNFARQYSRNVLWPQNTRWPKWPVVTGQLRPVNNRWVKTWE